VEARNGLLHPYDEKVTIQRTLPTTPQIEAIAWKSADYLFDFRADTAAMPEEIADFTKIIEARRTMRKQIVGVASRTG